MALAFSLRRSAAMLVLAVPLAAAADGVGVRFDAAGTSGSPFPSDRHTVADFTQASFKRVNLPKPDCAVRPSDCADIDVINTLDGFSTQPRITVPFDGDIDPASVTSSSVFLVNLGDVQSGAGAGQRVGINQVVWTPASRTLAFESDALLAEHSRYLLVVTTEVRDATGKRIKPAADARALGAARVDDGDTATALREASRWHRGAVAGASVFTTQSASGDLLKIMRQIKAATPAPASFDVGQSAAGPVRAVFPRASVLGIQWARQVGTAPTFSNSFLPTPALDVAPGAVGRIAYGRFTSPDYQTAAKFIPPVGTLSGTPQPQGANLLSFQLFLPAGARPANGWPVAIFGHGFTDSMYGAPVAVASVLASRGIATISIQVVGHGGGPLGTLTVLRNDGPPVVIPAGGRGIDQNGDGTIDSTEGVNAAPPRAIIGSRDGLRQTVVDLMQLVRQIEVGIDVDGDGSADLDASRIYYAGQSFGGIYGTMLLGVEPNLQAGVPNVPGGSITEVARLGAFRPLTGILLATRVPSLINVADPSGIAFNENIPLRNRPPLVDTVPGAAAIAELLDRNEWVQQAGNPVSYAALIRKSPPAGHAAKPVLIQFARGDVTVPNPTTTAIVRAGDLADRTVLFRNDLAHAANPAVARNPHTFLTNLSGAGAPFAVGAQTQIALFFATNGQLVVDPDAGSPVFEQPALVLPEDLGFIP